VSVGPRASTTSRVDRLLVSQHATAATLCRSRVPIETHAAGRTAWRDQRYWCRVAYEAAVGMACCIPRSRPDGGMESGKDSSRKGNEISGGSVLWHHNGSALSLASRSLRHALSYPRDAADPRQRSFAWRWVAAPPCAGWWTGGRNGIGGAWGYWPAQESRQLANVNVLACPTMKRRDGPAGTVYVLWLYQRLSPSRCQMLSIETGRQCRLTHSLRFA
jgi:hypothetical protein